MAAPQERHILDVVERKLAHLDRPATGSCCGLSLLRSKGKVQFDGCAFQVVVEESICHTTLLIRSRPAFPRFPMLCVHIRQNAQLVCVPSPAQTGNPAEIPKGYLIVSGISNLHRLEYFLNKHVTRP